MPNAQCHCRLQVLCVVVCRCNVENARKKTAKNVEADFV
jgi:hypothetical protein